MSLAKIEAIIEAAALRAVSMDAGAADVHPEERTAKKRPLGIPTWSDKLLQEVLRLILEAYYEPQFSDHSHGFRPGRGCHTALREVYVPWTGTTWFIEGDIAGCFDSIDHAVLLAILREKIHDSRFLRLIENLLKAGYLEDWRFHATLSGTPQGGIVSPILANIYLDRLDRFVETTLLPDYTRGADAEAEPAYGALDGRGRTGRDGRADREAAPAAQRQMQRLPVARPERPGLPAAPLRPLCGRLPARVQRAHGTKPRRSSGDSGTFLRETSSWNSPRPRP